MNNLILLGSLKSPKQPLFGGFFVFKRVITLRSEYGYINARVCRQILNQMD